MQKCGKPFPVFATSKDFVPHLSPKDRFHGPFSPHIARTTPALFHGQIHATTTPAPAWIFSPGQGRKDTFFPPGTLA
jgi:hypothetical protein